MPSVATSVEIAAPPEVVFRVLADLADYPRWCPFFKAVRGSAAVGARLEFDITDGRGGTRTARAVIVELSPARRIAWRGGLPLGLFRGMHSFDIVPSSQGSTVHDVEAFDGVLARFMLNEQRLAQQRLAFVAFDAALKGRCEHLHEAAA